MNKLTVGVIGAGWMGCKLGQVVAELPQAELVAISDPADDVEDRARLLGAKAYKDYERMLGKESLDAVIIATPETFHVEPTLAAVDAGCHIFLEKPIARTLDEADRIIEACRKGDRKLMIGYILRFDPSYVVVKEAVRNGEIGDFKSAYARRNGSVLEARRLGGRTSVTNYIAVHDIDQMLWYNEGVDVVSVYAKAVRGTVQKELGTWDFSWMMIEFRDGSLGVVETGWGLPANSWGDSRMDVIGTDGQISVDFVPMNVKKVDTKGWSFPLTRLWTTVAGRLEGAVKTEVEEFLSCITSDRQPSVGGQDGRRSLEVALAAEMSIEKGQAVQLPL